MGHGFIDRSSRMDSFVHRRDVRTKMILTLMFIVLVVSTPPQHLMTFVIYGGLLLWITAMSRVSPGHVLRQAALVLPFSILAALGLPFMNHGETVRFLGINLSVPGLWILAGASIKSMLGTIALILLAATTPFNYLLRGLSSLGMPRIFVDLLGLAFRYLHILIDETTRLRRAAAARGYAPKWLPQAVIIGRLVGNLFIRSYERAERVFGAMRLRGYNGQIPASELAPFRISEGLGLIIMTATLLTVRLFTK